MESGRVERNFSVIKLTGLPESSKAVNSCDAIRKEISGERWSLGGEKDGLGRGNEGSLMRKRGGG